MPDIMAVKTALATLAFAIAAGFFVQYGATEPGSAPLVVDPKTSAQSRSLMMATNANGLPVFGLPDVVTKPVNHTLNTKSTVAVRAVYTEMDVPPLGTILATPISGCPVDIMARRAAQAMVELAVALPCLPDQDVLVKHEFIQFSARTDGSGIIQVAIPALAVDASFEILVNNVEYARTSLPVPAVGNYDRAVLQWRGTSNLQLHALEGGAMIGDPGHVWSASVHDATGQRGFVQRLGTTQAEVPYFVEIYTYPNRVSEMDGDLSLQIGVALTPENCGRATDATTFQVRRGDMQMRQNMSVPMPGCDDIGMVVMLGDQFTATIQAMH